MRFAFAAEANFCASAELSAKRGRSHTRATIKERESEREQQRILRQKR